MHVLMYTGRAQTQSSFTQSLARFVRQCDAILSQVMYVGEKWGLWGHSPLGVALGQVMQASDGSGGGNVLWLLPT